MNFDTFKPNPKPAKTPKKKRKPIRSKSRKMTPEEYDFSLEVKALGCVVQEKADEIGDYCQGDIEYNHISICGRRKGHKVGIGLCTKHHRTGKISVHRAKKTFNRIFGTELELFEIVKRRLGITNNAS
jgi:hypothetical protein